jgi:hypothetical protein
LADLGVDGTIILEETLRKNDVKVWAAFIWVRMKSIGRLF